MSQIEIQYSGLLQTFSADPSLVQELSAELTRIVSITETSVMNSDDGYSHKFLLQDTAVKDLFKLLKLDPVEVERAFQSDWKYPPKTKMYSDFYYHILMLIVCYALRNNNELMMEHALLIILFKVWNGRKLHYIKYCDAKVMNYVIQNMLTGKHHASSYETPLDLLKNHSVPTLLKKYGPEILNKSAGLKTLFMQSYNRIGQMIAHNMRKNPITGIIEAQGGLLYLYLKAKEQGLYMQTPFVSDMNDQEDDTSEDNFYGNALAEEDILVVLTKYIAGNKEPDYSPECVSMIHDNSGIPAKIIEEILPLIHHSANHDIIHALLSEIKRLTRMKDIKQTLDNAFFDKVKQNVVNARDPKERRKINDIVKKLVLIIKKSNPGVDFSEYDGLFMVPKRQLFIYGLLHNMRQYVFLNQSRLLSPNDLFGFK